MGALGKLGGGIGSSVAAVSPAVASEDAPVSTLGAMSPYLQAAGSSLDPLKQSMETKKGGGAPVSFAPAQMQMVQPPQMQPASAYDLGGGFYGR